MDLQKICDDVQREWQMGGLSDGLYGDYAKEVARRAAEEEREACASVAEDTAASRDAEAIADAIRARSNAEFRGEGKRSLTDSPGTTG